MLPRRIVAQSARRSTFLVKGVIEIIFIGKFSQNFPASKIIDDGTTSLICTAMRAWHLSYPLVWAIVFIRCKGNARSLPMDKDNRFPHLVVFIKSRTEGTGR
jgi:hypothetical protein